MPSSENVSYNVRKELVDYSLNSFKRTFHCRYTVVSLTNHLTKFLECRCDSVGQTQSSHVIGFNFHKTQKIFIYMISFIVYLTQIDNCSWSAISAVSSTTIEKALELFTLFAICV